MDSLKAYDTAANEAAELKLCQKALDKVQIWVEGKDWMLYRRFFDLSKVEKQGRSGGHSCHSAEDSYREFKIQNPEVPALVIRDADFMRANGADLKADLNILYSDGHDHEMMCIRQPRVRQAIVNNLPEDIDAEHFYASIFHELRPLSYLKWYNYNNHSGYNFETFGLRTLKDDLLSDIRKIEQDVHARTCSRLKKLCPPVELRHIDHDDLDAFVSARTEASPYEITNGHDFLNRISHHLEKIDKAKRSESQLKEVIYAAFEFVFVNTDLYQSIRQWSETNRIDILHPQWIRS